MYSHSMEKIQLNLNKKFETYLNMLNHMMIISVSLYITWECYYSPATTDYTLHVWLSTIGYQLLMAEAILTMYSTNTWSFFHAAKTKRTLHWVIQLIGSVFAIAGTLILYWPREIHFATIHSVTGLISLILLLVTLVNGVTALWAQEFQRVTKIKSVYSKCFHNVMGIATFVIGVVSLYYGYEYTYFQESEEKDIRSWLMAFLIVTTMLSLLGALKALYQQLTTIRDNLYLN